MFFLCEVNKTFIPSKRELHIFFEIKIWALFKFCKTLPSILKEWDFCSWELKSDCFSGKNAHEARAGIKCDAEKDERATIFDQIVTVISSRALPLLLAPLGHGPVGSFSTP